MSKTWDHDANGPRYTVIEARLDAPLDKISYVVHDHARNLNIAAASNRAVAERGARHLDELARYYEAHPQWWAGVQR